MTSQRDILLVPFPFSDQSGKKVRPVLILSGEAYNQSGEDILVCAITSNLSQNKYTIIISEADLEMGILHEKSAIKADSILKISKKLIIKNIGILNKSAFQNVAVILKDIFGMQN